MKKIIISILSIIFLGSVILISCSKDQSNTEKEKDFTLESTINDLLFLRDSIGGIACERNIPVNELKFAYESNDTFKIQQLLGLTDNDIILLNSRLTVLRERLVSLNIELKNNVTNLKAEHCSSCDINTFFKNYDKYLAFSVMNLKNSNLKKTQELNCEYLQFTACLYLCALTGPVGYWPCSYLCYCSFCEDVGNICF